MKRNVAVGIAVAVVAVAAIGGELYARSEAERQVDALLAQAPITKATHGAVSYSLWRGRFEIADVWVETSLPSLPAAHAAHVEIGGLGPLSLISMARGGDIAVGKVKAEVVDATTPAAHYIIGDLSMEAPRYATAPPAGATPEDPAATLKRIGLKRIDLHDIRFQGDVADVIGDRTIERIVAENIDAGKVARFTATNIAMTMSLPIPSPGAAPDASPTRQSVKIAIGETDYTDIDLGVFTASLAMAEALKTGAPVEVSWAGAATVSKIAVTTTDGGVTVDHMGMSGVGVAMKGFSTTAAAIQPMPPDQLAAMEIAERIDHLELGGIAVSAPNGGKGHLDTLTLDGLTMRMSGGRPRVFLKSLEFDGLSGGNAAGEVAAKTLHLSMDGNLDHPTAAALTASAVEIPAALVPMLHVIGYEKLSLELDGKSSFDAATGIDDSTLRLAAANAGTLALDLHLGHVPQLSGSQDIATAMQQYSVVELDDAQLRYDDASLADRLLRLVAAQTGGSLDQARARIVAQITAQRAAFANKPAIGGLVDAAVKFLQQPTSLVVTAAPQPPIKLSEIQPLFARDPEAAAERLSLRVQ